MGMKEPMDTRRRPPSRDDRRAMPAPRSDGAAVEVIELGSTGPTGWRNGPVALLGVAVAGILAFAVIGAAVKPPAPSPSAPVIAIASQLPAATSVAPTSAPTRPPPPPTRSPAWQWRREDLLPDEGLTFPLGMWAVDGRVIVLAEHGDDDHLFARLESGSAWQTVAPPPAITEFMGGSVVDGEVYFLAKVGGVTDDDATLQLIRTANGEGWQSMGTATGLGRVDGVVFIGRVGDTLVASLVRWRPDLGEGAIEVELRWSEDGTHWEVADVPHVEVGATFDYIAMFGETMVVLGTKYEPEGHDQFLLTSTDGKTWRKLVFDLPQYYAPTALACDDAVCVVLADPFGGAETVQLALRTSDLGASWTSDFVEVPAGGQPIVANLTAIDAGFLAMGSYSGSYTGSAFVSADGGQWRALEVMAPGEAEYLAHLVVSGDAVIGLGSWDVGNTSIWTGSLSELLR
jgi:hypothetical protein